MKSEEFNRVVQNDVTVHSMLRNKSSLEEIIVALADEKQQLFQRVMELAEIAPKKITLPSGEVMIWRCPDELI